MRWALTEADGAAIRAKRLQAHGKEIPESLMPPEFLPGADAWFYDFWELSTDRQITGFGIGPIPAASIDRHTACWPGREAAMFRRCIRAMDAVFLRHQSGEGDVPESDNPARDAFRAAMR